MAKLPPLRDRVAQLIGIPSISSTQAGLAQSNEGVVRNAARERTNLSELESHEGRRERLRQNDLVARREVVALPLGHLCNSSEISVLPSFCRVLHYCQDRHDRCRMVVYG